MCVAGSHTHTGRWWWQAQGSGVDPEVAAGLKRLLDGASETPEAIGSVVAGCLAHEGNRDAATCARHQEAITP